MQRFLGGLLAATAVAALATTAQAAPTYFAVQTGMSGGQTGIDAVSTSSWTFTTGQSFVFGGGTFEMKRGSDTSAPITLSIYQGASAAGALVGAVTYTVGEFDTAHPGSNEQSFAATSFPFALALAASTQYFVALTSPAGTSGSEQYFIKGQSSTLRFVDEEGGAMPSEYVSSIDGVPTGGGGVTPPPLGVPAPAGVALFGLALALLGATRFARRPGAARAAA